MGTQVAISAGVLAANPWTEGAEADLAAALGSYRGLARSLKSLRFSEAPGEAVIAADARRETGARKLERARGRLDPRSAARLDDALRRCEAERERLETRAARIAAKLGVESALGAAEALRAIHDFQSGLRAAGGVVTQIRAELETARRLYWRALHWAQWLRGPEDPSASVRLADRAFAGATRQLSAIERDLDGSTLKGIDRAVARVRTVRHLLAFRAAQVARLAGVEPNPNLAALLGTLYSVPETGRVGWRYTLPAVLTLGLGIVTLAAIAVAYLH